MSNKINIEELQAIVGDRKVSAPFDDILFTDIEDMSIKEHDSYVDMVNTKANGAEVIAIAALQEDNDRVSIHYVTAEPHKFERIRRITGYLTGDINRWGDAKRAELRDRVKHA